MFGIQIIEAIMPTFNKILDLVPDPNEKAKLQQELMNQLITLSTKTDDNQVELNKIDSQNTKIFISGWRPFIGWIGGFAIAFQYLIIPLIVLVSTLYLGHPITVPGIDNNMMELVLAMLGLGGMRTFEKVKGINSGH